MLLFFVRHVPHALTTFSSGNTMLFGQQLLYIQKSDIAYIRGFLFEMGEAFYSNAIPAFFCMLAYVQGLSTSNIELL
jgi:hypothetical protein